MITCCMDYLLAVVVGGWGGVVWEYLANKPYGKHQTLVDSVFVNLFGTRVHLHHWLAYIVALAVLSVWGYFSGRLLHPAVVFLISVLVAAILYNFIYYDDEWMFVIGKERG